MKILSFGAGAVGTYLGGSLALSGHAVTFLERPEATEILHRNGLHLEIKGGIHTIPNPLIASSLSDALGQTTFDLALFALKSFDTRSAIQDIVPFAHDFPPLLCVQNGVENEAMLANVLGVNKVIPASLTSALARREVGDILLERLRGIGIAAQNALSRPLVLAMNEAGLNARLYAKADDMKWSKMLTNLIANATSAILDMTPGEIYRDPNLFRLEQAQLMESLQVMKAQNIQVVDLPGTPVRALVFVVEHLPDKLARPILTRGIGSGRGGKMPSFHIDLYHGRGKSEVEYLNGAVVRAGKKLGIPTPANQVLTETLVELTQGKLPLDTYKQRPDRLLERYEEIKSGS
jgi:2-dehydropantoate 2-reductase